MSGQPTLPNTRFCLQKSPRRIRYLVYSIAFNNHILAKSTLQLYCKPLTSLLPVRTCAKSDYLSVTVDNELHAQGTDYSQFAIENCIVYSVVRYFTGGNYSCQVSTPPKPLNFCLLICTLQSFLCIQQLAIFTLQLFHILCSLPTTICAVELLYQQ